jgi:hypothetical protein
MGCSSILSWHLCHAAFCRGSVILALFAAVFASGCGADTGGRVALSGNVTFQGQPLQRGSVEVVSEDGGQQTGAPIEQGRFSIPAPQGVTPGKYHVRIYSADETAAHNADEPPGPESMMPVAKEKIPPEFNSRTKLVFDVEERGANHFTIDIP